MHSRDQNVKKLKPPVSYWQLSLYTGCPKNGVLTVHHGVEGIAVNVRKIFKKFYWTYLLI
jgi:hypothetical protein